MRNSGHVTRTQARKTCPVCGVAVAVSWLRRHIDSGCRQARATPAPLAPRQPLFWLDSSLRLRSIETLARNGSYYGVRTLRPRAKRKFERVAEGMM